MAGCKCVYVVCEAASMGTDMMCGYCMCECCGIDVLCAVWMDSMRTVVTLGNRFCKVLAMSEIIGG